MVAQGEGNPLMTDHGSTSQKPLQMPYFINDKTMALEPKYRDQLLDIINQSMKGFKGKVFLFGSRARGTPRTTSDIDLAVSPGASEAMVSLLRENLENSTIPYSTDVIDLSTSDQCLVREVKKEGVLLWND